MKNTIDFVGKKKIFFGISLAIIIIGVICNIVFGTTLDIQFKGGAMVKYSYLGSLDENELKDTIQSVTDKQVTFAISQDLTNNTADADAYIISVQFSGTDAIDASVQDDITTALEKAYPDNSFAYVESSSVESAMGFKFLMKCIVAVIIACALMVLYVTIRFKKISGLSAGVTALIALFHDVAMIYFLYVIFRMPIDSSFIAVVLMILGYSLNDTIVIYDRVREERKNLGPQVAAGELFNISASKMFKRTIMTSVTTLIAIVTVYIVAAIFNIDSVKNFALPMIIGVISGCYSSICIAGPLWVIWQNKRHPAEN